MKNELRDAAVEGFVDSFRLTGALISAFFATMARVLAAFAHKESFQPKRRHNDDSRLSHS